MLNEREFIANMRLAGHIAQDVFLPILKQQIANKIEDAAQDAQKRVADLERRVRLLEEKNTELTEQIQIYRATLFSLTEKQMGGLY